jgi:hypothetical protein
MLHKVLRKMDDDDDDDDDDDGRKLINFAFSFNRVSIRFSIYSSFLFPAQVIEISDVQIDFLPFRSKVQNLSVRLQVRS